MLLLLLSCGPRVLPSAPDLLALPSGGGANTPVLIEDGDGLLLLWQQPGEVRISRWTDRDGWAEPQLVVGREDLVQNWADYPTVARGGDGALYVSWLAKVEGGPHAYDAWVSRGVDGAWHAVGPLHDDEVATEHGFVSLLPAEEGVQAWWLDGRAMPDGGPMSLRTALLTEDGVGAGHLVDERVCDCCRTAAVTTSAGPVVLYRDRSGDEVRDIGWAGPDGEGVLEDGWTIAGCPVNGPSAVMGAAPVAAWFTVADDQPRVRASVGLADPFTVAPAYGEPTPLGRTAVVADGDQAIVLWLDEDGALSGRRVGEGGVGPSVEVGRMSPERGSGFPTAVRHGESLLAVWTEPEHGLRSATVPLDRFGQLTGPAPDRARSGPPETLPKLALTNLAGEPLDLGGPVAISLWATWCPPCREELSRLQELHERGVPVVAIAIDDVGEGSRVASLVEELGLTLPVAHAPAAAEVFGAAALPATFVYAQDGSLVWWGLGLVDPALLERHLEGD